MKCMKCDNTAVIKLQHGAFCKDHFLYYIEEKVMKTFRQYKLIKQEDTVCVAASGGKDSLTALYMTNKFCKEHNIPMFALLIDEGIAGYRDHTKEDLETFCNKFEIKFYVASFEDEFGKRLDTLAPEARVKLGKKPCTVCGIFRRTLLNKYAKKHGATKLVTGHNLDDESQAYMMNVFQGNMKQNASLGPMSGLSDNNKYARRIKPLYFVSEKETRLFCLLKGFDVKFTECPNIEHSFRAEVRDMMNRLEDKYPALKSGIINSFLSVMPELKEKYGTGKRAEFSYCEKCGEPCSGEVCNSCKLRESLDCIMPEFKPVNLDSGCDGCSCNK